MEESSAILDLVRVHNVFVGMIIARVSFETNRNQKAKCGRILAKKDVELF